MPLFYLTLVYVSHLWTIHVDPRCARVVLGFRRKPLVISVILTRQENNHRMGFWNIKRHGIVWSWLCMSSVWQGIEGFVCFDILNPFRSFISCFPIPWLSYHSLLPPYIFICIIVNAWPFLETLERRHVSLAQLSIFSLSMDDIFTFCGCLPLFLCSNNATSFGLRFCRYLVQRNQLYIVMWV